MRAGRSSRERRRPFPGAAVALAYTLAVAGCSAPESVDELEAMQEQGRFAASIEPLREHLEEDPQDPRLNLLYGRALLRLGQSGSAVWPLRKAAEAPEWSRDGGLLLAEAFLRNGSEPDAIRVVDALLALDPEDWEALAIRAQAHLEAMDEESALADLDRLIAQDPDALESRLRRLVALLRSERVDEVAAELEAIGERLEEADEVDSALLASHCIVQASFAHERGEAEVATERWSQCLDAHPTDPSVVTAAVEFYAETSRGDRIGEVLETALALAPEQRYFRDGLAARRISQGRPDEAEALLLEGAREFPSARAWGALADFYSERGDYAAARHAVEQSMERMDPPPEIVLFGYGDVLIQAGDLERAREVIDELELPVYRHLLLGRLHMAEGDPAAAFPELEAGLRLWPNNGAARELAGRAAEQLGDFEAAAAQYREGVRELDVEATVALAELHSAHGRHRAAGDILRSALSKQPGEPAFWLALVRSSAEAGQESAVREALGTLAGLPGGLPLAAAEAMRLRRESGRPEAALHWLEQNPLDTSEPRHARALEEEVASLLALDRADEALARVEAAASAQPDRADLAALSGRVRIAAGALDAAEADLRRALERDPSSAPALCGLAEIAAARGSAERALALYDRAAASDLDDPRAGWAAFELARAGGDGPEALAARLEFFLRAHPHHAEAALALAELRVATGDLEGAESLAKRALGLGAGARGAELLARVRIEQGRPDRGSDANEGDRT